MKKRWPNRLLALVLLAGLLACAGDPPPTGATPAAPTNVTVSSGAGFVDVAWEHDGTNATGFVIYREAVATSTAAVRPAALTELAEVAATARSYRDQQVAVGTSYRYAVAAKGAGGRQSAPAAQTTAPLEPDPADTSIADYIVPPGVVATVTRVEGTIEEYDGGAVDATFASVFGGTGCAYVDGVEPDCVFTPGKPWIPTTIGADGVFSVELPASPLLDDEPTLFGGCGEAVPLALGGGLIVHDGPLGESGTDVLAQYARGRTEEPQTWYGDVLNAALFVLYAFASDEVDLTCSETYGTVPDQRADIDLRLRPGWNVMTWLMRREGDLAVSYWRTGEPGLAVAWRDGEAFAPKDIAPRIDAFGASPATISAGGITTLEWSVEGTEPIRLRIDPDVGVVSGTSNVLLAPAVTTTYTLTATNSAGIATADVTVTVDGALEGGDEVWSRTILETVGLEGWDWGAVASDAAGNVLAVSFDPGVLVKLDASGTESWRRLLADGIDAGEPGTVFAGTRVATDAAGNVYVAGQVFPPDDPDRVGAPECEGFLRKYDANGTEQWTRRLDAGRCNAILFSGVAVDADGNVVVAGTIETAGVAISGVVRRFEPDGTPSWRLTMGANELVVTAVAIDRWGTAYVAGSTVTPVAGAIVGRADAYVQAIDADGDLGWALAYGVVGGWVQVAGVAVDEKGDVVIAGSVSFDAGDPYDSRAFVRRFGADAATTWTRSLAPEPFSGGFAQFTGVAFDRWGNVVVAGDAVLDGETPAMHVRKYDPEGAVMWERVTPGRAVAADVATDPAGRVALLEIGVGVVVRVLAP